MYQSKIYVSYYTKKSYHKSIVICMLILKNLKNTSFKHRKLWFILKKLFLDAYLGHQFFSKEPSSHVSLAELFEQMNVEDQSNVPSPSVIFFKIFLGFLGSTELYFVNFIYKYPHIFVQRHFSIMKLSDSTVPTYLCVILVISGKELFCRLVDRQTVSDKW